MGDSEGITNIERSLQAIEGLSVSERQAAIGDLLQVYRQLEATLAASSSSDDLTRLADLENRFTRLKTSLQIKDLLSTCVKRLAPYTEGSSLNDLSQGETVFAQSQKELDWLAELQPAILTDTAFQNTKVQVNQLGARVRRAQGIRALKESIEKQWNRADKLESVDPNTAVDACKEALDKANALAGTMTDWGEDERDEVRLLLGEARKRYDDMRNRHEIPTTRQQGGELIQLIVDFAARAKLNPKTVVTYFEDETHQARPLPMSVGDAVEIARRRLITTFWSPKTTDYISEANKRLRVHQPREALAALQAWQTLPGLHDSRIGVTWPTNLKIQIEAVEEPIKGELQEFEAAERALYDARQELTRNPADPAKANEFWQKARDAYPYLDELTALRTDILARASAEAESLLKMIDRHLKKEEEWGLCELRLANLDALLALDSAVKTEFQARVAEARHLYELLKPLTVRGKDKINPDQELARLQGIESAYPDYWEGWPGKQTRLAELKARSDIQAILDAVARLCNAQASLVALETLHADCQNLDVNPPAGALAPHRMKLSQELKRLTAWMGLAQARDELAKAHVALTDDMTDAADASVAPDLSVIAQGVRDAEMDPQAAQAVRDLRLKDQLRALQANDGPVLQLLGQVKTAVANPSWIGLRDSLIQVRSRLAVPNSYRAELIGAQRDLQTSFAQVITSEIGRFLTDARQDFYASINMHSLTDYCNSLALLPQSTYGDGHLLARVQLAEKIGEAHQAKRAADSGQATWESARRVWEAARDLAHTQRDDGLHEYCQRQAKLCEKKIAFERIRSVDSREAERLLWGLCSDVAFRSDYEVYLEHGKHSLKLVQSGLRNQPTGSMPSDISDSLTKARDSLNLAETLAQSDGPSTYATSGLQTVMNELANWERLVNARQGLQGLYDAVRDQATNENCRKAVDLHRIASAALTMMETRQLFDAFWTRLRADLRRQLETRASAASDVFDRLDALLAIIILAPDDLVARGKLINIVNEAVRQTKQEIEDATYDTTAERFLAHYNLRQNQVRRQDEVNIAREQLADVRRLISRLEVLKGVLELVSSQAPILADELSSFIEEEEHLADWARQLDQFLRAVDQACHLIQDGLLEPDQFKVARYILRKGGTDSPAFLQIPDSFRDRAHPTYRWCQQLLEQAEKRRADQERLRWQIEFCLRHERVEKAADLPTDGVSQKERDLCDVLRRGLEASVHRRYPIEYALQLMREMTTGEKEDACGLQETLEYTDFDDQNRVYQSIGTIQAIINNKIAQVRCLREWLGQFRFGISLGTGRCPGIVSWPEERPKIETDRDSGPRGLGTAYRTCQSILDGSSDGLHSGLWSLRRASRALTHQAMLNELAAVLQPAPTAAETEIALCHLAQRIDGERTDRLQQIEGQIRECETLMQNIRWRNDNYKKYWDEFSTAYNDLMGQKRVLSFDHPAVQRFRSAADTFTAICPNYPDFQQALYDIAVSKHHVSHAALRKPPRGGA